MSLTKTIEVVKQGKGYSKTEASILKLLEEKRKIKKSDAGNHYTVFVNMLMSGLIEHAGESEYYQLTKDGEHAINFYKKFHKKAYESLKL